MAEIQVDGEESRDPTEKSIKRRADNCFLERSKLFDVPHVITLVTGGASGIGLMIRQVWMKQLAIC
jgi:hypothetical protein